MPKDSGVQSDPTTAITQHHEDLPSEENQPKSGVATRRDKFLTLALAAVVLAGYGIPIARGWLESRAMERDPERLRSALLEEIEGETSSYVTGTELITMTHLLPDPSTKSILLQFADDPRPMVAYTATSELHRLFPDSPDAMAAVRRYSTDPHQVALLRDIWRKEIEKSDPALAKATAEVLDRQRGLFPREGYF